MASKFITVDMDDIRKSIEIRCDISVVKQEMWGYREWRLKLAKAFILMAAKIMRVPIEVESNVGAK